MAPATVFKDEAANQHRLLLFRRPWVTSNGNGPLIKSKLPAMSSQQDLLDFKITTQRATELEKAVIFSAQLENTDLSESLTSCIPQYALLGVATSINNVSANEEKDNRVFLNTNYPSSFFICGVQGSGKSHTTACIIENNMLMSSKLGPMKSKSAGIVFHYSQFTSGHNFRPCEASYLAQVNPEFPTSQAISGVYVLVSPSNYHNLSKTYAAIAGVTVKKLKLPAQRLDISSLLMLMSFDQSGSAPLYLSQITRVLRATAERRPGPLNYMEFKAQLMNLDFNPQQKLHLDQRLDLLESFLDLNASQQGCFDFSTGRLTIIDLTCPFVDESTACSLFNICLGMFLDDSSSLKGKVVVVDEAHKYLTDTPAAKLFTDSLLSLIRQQRHFAARVLITTQEPSISPRLISLSSAVIIHRFTSPDWFKVLGKHISISKDSDDAVKVFKGIADLDVGEALVFAPSAFVAKEEEGTVANDPEDVTEHYKDDQAGKGKTALQCEKLGQGLMTLRIRKRITADGGRSVMSV